MTNAEIREELKSGFYDHSNVYLLPDEYANAAHSLTEDCSKVLYDAMIVCQIYVDNHGVDDSIPVSPKDEYDPPFTEEEVNNIINTKFSEYKDIVIFFIREYWDFYWNRYIGHTLDGVRIWSKTFLFWEYACRCGWTSLNKSNEELFNYVEACGLSGEDIIIKVKGIRTRIHIKDVKDKYVFKQMSEDTFRQILSNRRSVQMDWRKRYPASKDRSSFFGM